MVLTEKRVPFERVEIDLTKREQKTPEFQAINPLGLVPVYEDDEGIHPDSLYIMQYLDERYPQPRFFPQDTQARQKVLEWIELSSSTYRDVSHYLYWQLIEPPAGGTDWDEVKRLKKRGMALLERMDNILDSEEFICGPLTAADFGLFPWVHGYQRFDLPPQGMFPHVVAWRDRIAVRPSFKTNYQKRGRPFEFRIE